MGSKMMSMGRSLGLSCCLCRRNRALLSKSNLCDPYYYRRIVIIYLENIVGLFGDWKCHSRCIV